MPFCRSRAGYTSGNCSVNSEEREGRDQAEIAGEKVQLSLRDKAHPIGIV